LQLLESVVVSTQLEPQSVGVGAEHPDVQEYVLPDPEQSGVPPVHPIPHAPQLLAVLIFVSHPWSGPPSPQCACPDAHAPASNSHTPPAPHATWPLTLGSIVQSCPHAPQLCGSFATQPPSHSSWPVRHPPSAWLPSLAPSPPASLTTVESVTGPSVPLPSVAPSLPSVALSLPASPHCDGGSG
jgi:hypothetical protein